MFANKDHSANVCALVKFQASKAMQELKTQCMGQLEAAKSAYDECIEARDVSKKRIVELEQELQEVKDDLGSQIDVAHGRYRKVSVTLKCIVHAYPAWAPDLMFPVVRS